MPFEWTLICSRIPKERYILGSLEAHGSAETDFLDRPNSERPKLDEIRANAASNNGDRALLNALSVDVEDYFQTEAMSGAAPRGQWDAMPSRVERNTERMFELFASRGVRGTFFFLGW